MSRPAILILVAVAVLLVVSIVFQTRLAAGGGALLLIGAIVYETLRNRNNPKGAAVADQGAKDLRKDINRDPEYREE
jgi:hypothetical protein